MIRHRLVELRQRAETHGWAIGIGHPHPQTVRAMQRFLSAHEGVGQDVVMVHVSDLV